MNPGGFGPSRDSPLYEKDRTGTGIWLQAMSWDADSETDGAHVADSGGSGLCSLMGDSVGRPRQGLFQLVGGVSMKGGMPVGIQFGTLLITS